MILRIAIIEVVGAIIIASISGSGGIQIGQNVGKQRQQEQDQNSIAQLNEEKQSLEAELENANCEIEELKNQQLNSAEAAKMETQNLKAELEESDNRVAELEENIKELSTQLNSKIVTTFENIPVYLEGLRISQEGDNSVALVNGGIYYHENLVKTILENYNKSYEYSENKIDITTNIDDSSFLVSKAEIYEIDGSVSMSSGIRQDINGNEFSGILFSGNGKVSVLLNEKYTKLKGIVHVAKESINDRDCRVIIYKADKYGNTTQVHESKDLTKLSGIDDFSNGCDIEGAVVLTIESHSAYGNCCLISDIPENTEVVHDKALSFEKGNETDLQKKLQMLLDDENLVRKYKKEAAPYILDRYNWDIVVDQMLRVYAGDVVDYNTVLQERESRNGVIQSK